MWPRRTIDKKQKMLSGEAGLHNTTRNNSNEISSNLETLCSNSDTTELPNPGEVLKAFEDGQQPVNSELSNNAVYPPICYGYYSFEDVVQQLRGHRRIHKHSQKKKLN